MGGVGGYANCSPVRRGWLEQREMVRLFFGRSLRHVETVEMGDGGMTSLNRKKVAAGNYTHKTQTTEFRGMEIKVVGGIWTRGRSLRFTEVCI